MSEEHLRNNEAVGSVQYPGSSAVSTISLARLPTVRFDYFWFPFGSLLGSFSGMRAEYCGYTSLRCLAAQTNVNKKVRVTLEDRGVVPLKERKHDAKATRQLQS